MGQTSSTKSGRISSFDILTTLTLPQPDNPLSVLREAIPPYKAKIWSTAHIDFIWQIAGMYNVFLNRTKLACFLCWATKTLTVRTQRNKLFRENLSIFVAWCLMGNLPGQLGKLKSADYFSNLSRKLGRIKGCSRLSKNSHLSVWKKDLPGWSRPNFPSVSSSITLLSQ